jgi:hypothetical protein
VSTFSDPGRRNDSHLLLLLGLVVCLLAAVAAGAGLFWPGGQGSSTFTSLHGQSVEIYGKGVYRYDSLFKGSGNRGTDAVTLLVGIPLLVVSLVRSRQGSARARLLLTGSLAWFVYVGASSLGAIAYNDLFIVYVALFSSSLFAFIVAFVSIDPAEVRFGDPDRAPRLGLAAFMVVSGGFVVAVWMIAPISGLITGEVPKDLETYTTLFTNGLDVAVIAPSAFIAGVLILRREPLGYLIAVPLLVLEALLAPLVAAMTVSQVQAGVTFTTGEIVGPIVGFAVLALIALGFLVAILRAVDEVDATAAAAAR